MVSLGGGLPFTRLRGVAQGAASARIGAKDANGNVVHGDVYLDGVENSLVRAESRMVAAIGVSNLLIVETADAVLVAYKDRAQDVKKVVDFLKASGRSEHQFHTRVFRPWGWYEGIDIGERFQVKRIMVKPGESCHCRCTITAPNIGWWSPARHG